MRTLILIMAFCGNTYAQTQHFSSIDLDYLNYTRNEILKQYEGQNKYDLIIDEPGRLIFADGDCYLSWPLYIAEYQFKDDSLAQLVIALADTAGAYPELFEEVLQTFKNWYGNEYEYKNLDDDEYYFWYFREENEVPEAAMFICHAADISMGTMITQFNIRRMKKDFKNE